LAQVSPDIWNSFSLEAKKWLLNERKHQQQEDEKLKKSRSTNRDTTKPTLGDTSTPSSNSNMPNQYARVKNGLKGEDEIQDQPTNTYGFIDEFLEDAIKSSDLFEE
jgi:hypothetical protein